MTKSFKWTIGVIGFFVLFVIISAFYSINQKESKKINNQVVDEQPFETQKKADQETEKVLNKFLPGFGKKIGEEGFNLGTEIIDQGRKLKQSGLERVTDKIIEKKQEENNKDKETKK